jgi:Calcium binding
MGWYYYLESKIHFPFSAKCIVAHPLSLLGKGETVSARRLAPEQLCAHDMLVRAAWQGRNFAIPLSQLTPVATDPSTHCQQHDAGALDQTNRQRSRASALLQHFLLLRTQGESGEQYASENLSIVETLLQ